MQCCQVAAECFNAASAFEKICQGKITSFIIGQALILFVREFRIAI